MLEYLSEEDREKLRVHAREMIDAQGSDTFEAAFRKLIEETFKASDDLVTPRSETATTALSS